MAEQEEERVPAGRAAWRERDRGDRCWTCGRRRGIEPKRASFGTSPDAYIPRTDDPDDSPAQIANDLICRVSVYRNGGTNDSTHLCNECLRIGLRAIKVRVCELLDELDLGHDKDAEIAELTKRLAHLQLRHHNVCYAHDRMQGRLADLLGHVSSSADAEVVRVAEFEVQRGAVGGGRG